MVTLKSLAAEILGVTEVDIKRVEQDPVAYCYIVTLWNRRRLEVMAYDVEMLRRSRIWSRSQGQLLALCREAYEKFSVVRRDGGAVGPSLHQIEVAFDIPRGSLVPRPVVWGGTGNEAWHLRYNP